jgi:steroid delta-isomerase-like uncharacterized protein
MEQDVERPLMLLAEAWSSHDIDRLLTLYTENGSHEDVTFGIGTHGKGELRAFAEAIFAAFPDFRLDVKSQFVAGAWGAMEWVMSGTHARDVQGMPATHKKFAVRGARVAELEGKKINRTSDYWDLSAFLKQTGSMLNG